MDGARTRGQPVALRAIAAMIRGPVPHAVLLVGPDGVGKTTLAVDLAAGLLCTAEPSERPCRQCRACRLVDSGGHPDLHRLGPVGPGRQVVIGGPDAKFRGVRDLVVELALMPAEGGARVAIIEGAERMNEDAQSALLKTLEEPPPGVTIVLCADGEDRLLPTVRSRCFRVRLGLVGPRDIEAIVADHGLVDPPTAARLGRLAGGRPGLALAYARAPEAVLIRAELARSLLDLTDAASVRAAGRRARRDPAGHGAGDGARIGRPCGTRPPRPAGAGPRTRLPWSRRPSRRRRSRTRSTSRPRPAASPPRIVAARSSWCSACGSTSRAISSSSGSGGSRSVHDTVLLDELAAIVRLDRARRGDGVPRTCRRGRPSCWPRNVSPELILDSLVARLAAARGGRMNRASTAPNGRLTRGR